MNLGQVFADPLIDLGAEDAAFAGIHALRSLASSARVGVTAQFLECAADYHRNFLNVGYWRFLLDQAFGAAGLTSAPATVLDIGSGSGNSVIPLAERFPNTRIIATDISPQLLAILRDFVRLHLNDPDRIALVCADAMHADYRPEVADIVVGAAILHHILDPVWVLASCHRALKPGGWAMFFEPFDAGNTIVKLTYQRILAQASPAEKATEAMRLLERVVADYSARQRPRSDPIYLQLDDKWMFTRTYFERIKADQGWAELITYPLNLCATLLRKQAEVQLKLGAQLTPGALPDWAWAVIDETDAGLSDDLRREWAPEAAILLRKAPIASSRLADARQ